MTEDEAKTRWCPFVRLGDCERGFGHNRWDDASRQPPDSARCIGSACMAWRRLRSSGTSMLESIREHRARTGATLAEAKNYVAVRPELWNESDGGYCGLAGRPE